MEDALRLIDDDGPALREERPEPQTCEGCGDKIAPQRHPFHDGWLPIADRCQSCEFERRQAQEARDRRLERYQRGLDAADIPSRARKNARRDDVELHKLLRSMTKVPPGEERDITSVYIWGEVGTGKSVQCALAIQTYLERWVLEEGEDVIARYANPDRLLRRRKRSFDDGPAVDVETLETCDLLVLDDLGAERGGPDDNSQGSDWARSVLYGLIDERYQAQKLTIFTSNFRHADLDGHYNYTARTTSRIWEMCGGADRRFQSIHLTTNWRRAGGAT